jgi:hypothetical protein
VLSWSDAASWKPVVLHADTRLFEDQRKKDKSVKEIEMVLPTGTTERVADYFVVVGLDENLSIMKVCY